jgi:hypothetical protein
MKVTPYQSQEVVDRKGFVSGTLAVRMTQAGALTVQVLHSDTANSGFAPVIDFFLNPDGAVATDALEGIAYRNFAAQTGDVVNFDLDLLSLKRFIRIKIDNTGEGEYAFALLDPMHVPL